MRQSKIKIFFIFIILTSVITTLIYLVNNIFIIKNINCQLDNKECPQDITDLFLNKKMCCIVL